jgi:hypothetical protein
MRLHPTLPIEEFPDLAAEMLYHACPTPDDEPFFTLHMGVAVRLGLNWIECLHYVLELRRGLVH